LSLLVSTWGNRIMDRKGDETGAKS
jgi:hypothetical protein